MGCQNLPRVMGQFLILYEGWLKMKTERAIELGTLGEFQKLHFLQFFGAKISDFQVLLHKLLHMRC